MDNLSMLEPKTSTFEAKISSLPSPSSSPPPLTPMQNRETNGKTVEGLFTDGSKHPDLKSTKILIDRSGSATKISLAGDQSSANQERHELMTGSRMPLDNVGIMQTFNRAMDTIMDKR